MANTATPAKSLSTAAVQPQDRGFDSEREKFVTFVTPLTADAYPYKFKPYRKIQITRITLLNGNVTQATATNTVAVDVDIYSDGATPAKVHDVAAKAATTGLAAEKGLDLTLSTTLANTICENTEMVRALITVVGTMGPCTLQLAYVELDANSPSVAPDWTV